MPKKYKNQYLSIQFKREQHSSSLYPLPLPVVGRGVQSTPKNRKNGYLSIRFKPGQHSSSPCPLPPTPVGPAPLPPPSGPSPSPTLARALPPLYR